MGVLLQIQYLRSTIQYYYTALSSRETYELSGVRSLHTTKSHQGVPGRIRRHLCRGPYGASHSPRFRRGGTTPPHERSRNYDQYRIVTSLHTYIQQQQIVHAQRLYHHRHTLGLWENELGLFSLYPVVERGMAVGSRRAGFECAHT